MPPYARAVLLGLSTLATANAFNYLSDHSFAPPFADFDSAGMRKIPGWERGGDASVGEHFVRLTSDRQSKTGWLWNKEPMAADEWSLTLRFRISGSGKDGLHGDGLALWFTDDSSFVKGELHGYRGRFKGFGVVMDTYKNAPAPLKNDGAAGVYKHYDVLFVSNDGSQELTSESVGFGSPIGCDAELRYWEERHSFNPAKNYSQVRVAFDGKNNAVSVWVDERGTDDFKLCVDRAKVKAAASNNNNNWWRPKVASKETDRFHKDEENEQQQAVRLVGGARLGLTASTGALADNHDVLSLAVGLGFDKAAPAYLLNYGGHDPATLGLHAHDNDGDSADVDAADAVEAELVPAGEHANATSGDGRVAALKVSSHSLNTGSDSSGMKVALLSSGDDKVDAAIHSAIARENALLNERLVALHHHLEHTVARINDHLKAAVKRVADQEGLLEERVKALEKRVLGEVAAGIDSMVDSSLQGRIIALEHQLGIAVDRKLSSEFMPGVRSSIDTSIEGVRREVHAKSRASLLGFAMLGIAVLAVAAISYNRYRYLLKKHIL